MERDPPENQPVRAGKDPGTPAPPAHELLLHHRPGRGGPFLRAGPHRAQEATAVDQEVQLAQRDGPAGGAGAHPHRRERLSAFLRARQGALRGKALQGLVLGPPPRIQLHNPHRLLPLREDQGSAREGIPQAPPPLLGPLPEQHPPRARRPSPARPPPRPEAPHGVRGELRPRGPSRPPQDPGCLPGVQLVGGVPPRGRQRDEGRGSPRQVGHHLLPGAGRRLAMAQVPLGLDRLRVHPRPLLE
mmetsp:Transcript_2759/g.6292  ORF Transcript_2759/g.6292 Transcript_2759/m.6292 type:complete len:244 (+) Transcript_2759:359-1090(+)